MTTTTHPSELGRPVILAERIRTSCTCLAGAGCPRPGAHPLLDRWWTSHPTKHSDPDTEVNPRTTYGAPGVVIPRGRSVLQIPVALRLDLLRHLAGTLAAPPIIHTPLRSWVWTHALPSPGGITRHPLFLPHPASLVVVHAGAWIPLPPTRLPGERPLTWGGGPTGAPLSGRSLERLLARLSASLAS